MYSPSQSLKHPILMIKSPKTANVPMKEAKPRRRRSRPKQPQQKLQTEINEMAPVSYASTRSFRTDVLQSHKNVKSREQISSITGSNSFLVGGTFHINPGLPECFPYLSDIAKKFQQYRFKSLTFEFVTSTATTTTGNVILSPEYNPKELPPATEQQATNTYGAVESVCWRNSKVSFSPSGMFPLGPRKMIRSCLVPSDLQAYDAGQLFVCVTGQTGNPLIGKLWVSYDVDLYIPQNSLVQDYSPSSAAMFTIVSTALTSGVATLLTLTTVYDPFGFTNNGNTLSLLKGVYRMDARFTVDGASVTNCLTQFSVGGVLSTTHTYVAGSPTLWTYFGTGLQMLIPSTEVQNFGISVASTFTGAANAGNGVLIINLV
ncbi:putative capsid protein [Wenzhou narna-like virus 5]|uniref:putative capsid protein n=1 Tax=Wenzhou narna-like virus 5 TaxID=1923580 RepID=UPI00090C2BD8|nr:putative capsid protein [Wenzhou narna-like virus 5]APG77274.1 putative capsid protein [Wenzhou narna-like virus 5]